MNNGAVPLVPFGYRTEKGIILTNIYCSLRIYQSLQQSRKGKRNHQQKLVLVSVQLVSKISDSAKVVHHHHPALAGLTHVTVLPSRAISPLSYRRYKLVIIFRFGYYQRELFIRHKYYIPKCKDKLFLLR